MKKIQKIAPRKFKVSTLDVPGADIELDFNPLVERFNLNQGRQDYKLIHWQGRPKGDRQWGIYDPVEDSYICGVFEDHRTMYGGTRLLMLDDSTANTLPSAVLYFVGSLPIIKSEAEHIN